MSLIIPFLHLALILEIFVFIALILLFIGQVINLVNRYKKYGNIMDEPFCFRESKKLTIKEKKDAEKNWAVKCAEKVK